MLQSYDEYVHRQALVSPPPPMPSHTLVSCLCRFFFGKVKTWVKT